MTTHEPVPGSRADVFLHVKTQRAGKLKGGLMGTLVTKDEVSAR